MANKKKAGGRRDKPVKRPRMPRAPRPTLIFSLDQLLAMQEALRSVIEAANADQLPALWNLESLINLEASRHHWTRRELRRLRHHVVRESIEQLGWTKGLEVAAERLKGHPNPVGTQQLRKAYADEERLRSPEQRRQRTWRRN